MFIKMLRSIGYFFLKMIVSIKFSGRQNISESNVCIIAPNHLSDLDGPLMFLISKGKVTFFMNADHYNMPVLNFICKIIGCIPVYKNKGNFSAIESGIIALKSGKSIVIFPEGKRCKPGELGKFRKGVAVLARETGVPVVPVGIAGTDKAMPPHKPWIPKPYPVTVKFGEPIYIQKWESLESFTERLKERVAGLCGIFQEEELYVSSD